MHDHPLVGLIANSLTLTYLIFLILYLYDDKKFENQMSERNQNFRMAAIVITWIYIVLYGLSILFNILSLVGMARKS